MPGTRNTAVNGISDLMGLTGLSEDQYYTIVVLRECDSGHIYTWAPGRPSRGGGKKTLKLGGRREEGTDSRQKAWE